MILFVNGNCLFFQRVKNCKSPTIFEPGRAIIPYLIDSSQYVSALTALKLQCFAKLRKLWWNSSIDYPGFRCLVASL